MSSHCALQHGFKNDEHSGIGWASKENFVDCVFGHWENGQLRGHCRMVLSAVFFGIGDFLEFKLHGKGKLNMFGEKYVGCLTDNDPNGTSYIGSWENDKRQGHGMLIYADGCHFIGEFAQDQQGKGKYVYSSQKVSVEETSKEITLVGPPFNNSSFQTPPWREWLTFSHLKQ